MICHVGVNAHNENSGYCIACNAMMESFNNSVSTGAFANALLQIAKVGEVDLLLFQYNINSRTPPLLTVSSSKRFRPLTPLWKLILSRSIKQNALLSL